MPQDHPAPVSGERGTHRRLTGCRDLLTGCRDLPRYTPDCIHPADPGCPQRVTAKGNSPSSPDAYRRCPSPSIPVWPGPSPIPVSRYSSPGVHSAPVVRRPGAPSVPVIRRPPPGGRLFLRCRRPGSGFVDETNILCRRRLPPVPHCARTLPKTPLLCHFPKNARFRQYGFFRTPAKPGVSEGVFGVLAFKRRFSARQRRQTAILRP